MAVCCRRQCGHTHHGAIPWAGVWLRVRRSGMAHDMAQRGVAAPLSEIPFTLIWCADISNVCLMCLPSRSAPSIFLIPRFHNLKAPASGSTFQIEGPCKGPQIISVGKEGGASISLFMGWISHGQEGIPNVSSSRVLLILGIRIGRVATAAAAVAWPV